jgi:hypothetical protein
MQTESRPNNAFDSSPPERQRELVAQARAELEKPQPNWLLIKELAERATQPMQADGTPVAVVRPEVEAARLRAESALAEVRPIVAEADGLLGVDNMARVYLDHAEQAFENAVAAPTAHAAIDGFRLAEESANAAHEHAIGLRAQAGRKLTGLKAGKLLWRARCRPAASE